MMELEKRSMAGSDVWLTRVAQAVWSVWRVDNGVKDGFQANSWVFRAVSLIADSIASVPWVVFDNDNTALWDHPVSKLLRTPNPHWSRNQMMHVIACWLQLSGNAYLKMVLDSNRAPAELWPVSPDRLAPKPSADPTKFIDGYEELDRNGVKRMSIDYTPENTIHIKLTDPANPYVGISPIGAAARAVDLDNAQMDWNKSGMQNRGVFDGMFSFKQAVDAPMAKSLADRIKEKFLGVKNARKPLVLGSDAQYQRMSLTPAEVDFLASRKFNREEIFIVFGVPPQLGGSQEASTYNNFATATRIFWETKILPDLDRIRDSLQAMLQPWLSEGLTIGPDLSNIRALQENEDERAKVAELYTKMGVPFSQINERYELGFQPWPGWDKPRSVTAAGGLKLDEEPADDSKRWAIKPAEQRSPADEAAARDRYAEGPLKRAIADLLDVQRRDVFDALEKGGDARDAAMLRRDEWRALLTKAYLDVALPAGAAVLDGVRGKSPRLEKRDSYSYNPEMVDAINQALETESTILNELSLINESTVRAILEQIAYGIDNEMTTAGIQQALLDTGVFSAERALRISRTVAGSAMSVGQLTAGKMAGAETKTWNASGLETREEHMARDGEEVGIDERFSVQFGSVGPRYPCDPEIEAADRVNCFLPGTEIRGNVTGASRAFYKGQAVEIVTRSGRVVRVTDNHPILAENGFVFARKIQVGDNLVCCVVNDDTAKPAMVPDENHKPTKIEQVFSSISELGFREFPWRSADNFYGDGQFIEGDVEIVWADSALLRARKPAITQSGSDISLKVENLSADSLDGCGSGASGLNAVKPATACIPRSATLALNDVVIHEFKSRPFDALGFGLTSRLKSVFDQLSIDGASVKPDRLGDSIDRHSGDEHVGNVSADFVSHDTSALHEPEFAALLVGTGRDAVSLEGAMDGRSADPEAVSNFLHRNQGLIELDDVVAVSRFTHDGPVYDVMTRNGIVSGGDIITSNCRCWLTFG